MKKFLMLIVVFVILLAPLSATAQPMEENMGPAESVEAVYDAIAAQDVDSAMALFADNAVFTIVPGAHGTDGVFAGKEEIRGWYEALAEGQGSAVFSDVEVSGNSAAWTLSWWDDSLIERGTAPYVMDGASVAQNGQIMSLSMVMTPETLAKRAAYKTKAAHEELAHRFLEEMWDEGNMETGEEILADDFVDHYPRPGNAADKAGIMEDAAGFAEIGLNNQLEKLYVTEDAIAMLVTVTDPGGETFEVAIFLGVEDGQITDRRVGLLGWGE